MQAFEGFGGAGEWGNGALGDLDLDLVSFWLRRERSMGSVKRERCGGVDGGEVVRPKAKQREERWCDGERVGRRRSREGEGGSGGGGFL